MKDDMSKTLLDNLSDGVYYVDKDRNITYWNTTAEQITGYLKSDIVGRSCASNILRHMDVTGHELCENGCPLQLTIQDGVKREAFVFLHHKQGHRVPVHVRVAPLTDKEGEVIGAIETFSENSTSLDMMKELECLRKDIFQDPLLGIGNRRLAETMFETHAYKQDTLGVVFFDIDSFKNINDLYGHSVGDNVLIMASQSVISALRQSDLFFRWGGDEFLIFLPNISQENLQVVAERVNIFIERSFIIADNQKISVTASTGATFAKADEALESVIKRSDALMYNSKNTGRNKVTVG
jgi:diguanylate cyclase (GGDEF)-like protein/PAS domain S-box-containing protein